MKTFTYYIPELSKEDIDLLHRMLGHPSATRIDRIKETIIEIINNQEFYGNPKRIQKIIKEINKAPKGGMIRIDFRRKNG